jgi:predicted nuclease with TOPRIM domain
MSDLKESFSELSDRWVEALKENMRLRKRNKELEAALNRIAMEDAKLDEPALWLDDDMPLGLFIAMTLGEKKDGN